MPGSRSCPGPGSSPTPGTGSSCRRAAATHARLDVYPDGGLSRVRLYGELTPAGREELGLRWLNTLPEPAALRALVTAGLADDAARAVVGARPVTPADVPGSVRSVLLGRDG